jgi:hypothetical protein
VKKIGEYTTRGKVPDRTTKRIPLFDGRFDTGYRIISFQVLPDDPDAAAGDVTGVLATETGAATVAWDLSDQRQIAWAGNKNDAQSSTQMAVIDPDNFIVEDLYFHGKNGATTSVNYIITMEKYETTDWMGALTMVRNSAQDV